MNIQTPHIKFIDKTKEKFKNYSQRPANTRIDTLVIHYTYLDFKKSFYTLTEGQVSSHFLIDRDGSIYYLVDTKHKAWHAGVSFWRGKSSINNNSIGIEIVNKGQEVHKKEGKFIIKSYENFTEAQYESLDILIKQLKQEKQLEIQDKNIIGHGDVTAYDFRKIDPGIGFNWQKLQQQGHGIYYKPKIKDDHIIFNYLDKNNDIGPIQQKLADIGYKIDINNHLDEHTANVMLTFNMHYNQEYCMQSEISQNQTMNYIEYGIWRHSANEALKHIHKQIRQ